MGPSPIDELLAAFDAFDLERAIALMAPECRLLTLDGRHGEGADGVRDVLATLLGELHATSHRVTAQWQVDDVWIAEVLADYVLQDRFEMKEIPRAFIVRTSAAGIAEVRVYGAHERRLSQHSTGDGSMLIGGRLMPPL